MVGDGDGRWEKIKQIEAVASWEKSEANSKRLYNKAFAEQREFDLITI